jgi:hypothetical protein
MKAIIFDYDISYSIPADISISINMRGTNRKQSQNYVLLSDHHIDMDYFNIATSELYSFAENIYNGRPLREIVSIDDISLWWLYEASLREKYVQYLKYKYAFKNLFYKIHVDEIISDVTDPIAQSVIRDFCKRECISLNIKTKKLNMLKKYIDYANSLLRHIIPALLSWPGISRRSAQAVILSYAKYWTRYNVIGDIKKDGIFNEIQEEMEKRDIDYAGLEYNNESILNFIKLRWEKWLHEKGVWIPLLAYLDLDIVKKSILEYNKVGKNIASISVDEEEKFALSLLSGYIKKSLVDIIYMKCLSKAIDLINPHLILISCEHCIPGRMAIIIGNRKGLTTIAMQHGVITSTSSGYIFQKKEKVSFSGEINERPLPKYTLVYGKTYKDLLVEESGYPPDSVIIAGHPRYDILARANEIYSREAFFLKMGLEPKKKLIFSTTDGLPEINVSNNAYGLLRVCSEMSDRAQLLIKPHPNNVDRELYLRANNELGAEAIITSDLNLYEAIFASDVLVTWISTTALEAILLDRPVIVLNLTSEPDRVDYVRQKVAFGAHSEAELSCMLDKIFKGDKSLEENRKAFVSNHVSRVDGRAASRVVDLISNCLSRYK